MTEIHDSSKEKTIKLEAKYIGYIAIILYILILSVLMYIKESQIPYSLFSILFIGQGFESLYKYRKYKNRLDILATIGCIIAFVGLIILMIK